MIELLKLLFVWLYWRLRVDWYELITQPRERDKAAALEADRQQEEYELAETIEDHEPSLKQVPLSSAQQAFYAQLLGNAQPSDWERQLLAPQMNHTALFQQLLSLQNSQQVQGLAQDFTSCQLTCQHQLECTLLGRCRKRYP